MVPRKQETTLERLAREQLVARVRATRKQGDTLDRLVLKGIWGRDGAMVAVPPKRELNLNFKRQRADIAGDPEGLPVTACYS